MYLSAYEFGTCDGEVERDLGLSARCELLLHSLELSLELVFKLVDELSRLTLILGSECLHICEKLLHGLFEGGLDNGKSVGCGYGGKLSAKLFLDP